MSDQFQIPVDHVSDTAYLVAYYRGAETDAADAKFNDPYAKILAAPKAHLLETAMPFSEEGRWLMTVRTCLLDAHIERLVREDGVDTVVNLAAGLDTRPYRLDLPKTLRWIEADLPGITKYKADRLLAETPRCEIERIALDLSDDVARRQLFSYFGDGDGRTLVITEGLLPYLPEAVVRNLAAELRALPAVRHWLMDVTTTGFLAWFKARMNKAGKVGDVALHFFPENGVEYFDALGWQTAAFDSFVDGGTKLGRPLPTRMQVDGNAAILGDDSGIALLAKR